MPPDSAPATTLAATTTLTWTTPTTRSVKNAREDREIESWYGPGMTPDPTRARAAHRRTAFVAGLAGLACAAGFAFGARTLVTATSSTRQVAAPVTTAKPTTTVATPTTQIPPRYWQRGGGGTPPAG